MTRPTVLLLASLLYAIPGSAVARGPRVFKVCNRRAGPCGPGGGIRSISRAIKRAKPGDWVLIWPGVYHEKGTPDAGVMITTPGIHVRGMDRNLVIVDGSNGTAAAPCPADASLQDLTARNGIEVFKASSVSIENLTVCNYLANYGDGGHLILEDSEWDQNKAGIVPSSLNNDDAPPPQNGQCPGGTGSCTIFRRNHVHDNNNPNVPAAGISGEAPVGTGIEIVGGMFDTIEDNVVENQGAWGIVTHDFPDTETPPPIAHCEGGIQSGPVCVFEAKGNVTTGNLLQNNGFFGNPTNGDLAN